MKKTVAQPDSTASFSQENIAERARKLWEGYGRPAGRDKEIWLEAERQLLGVDPLVEGTANVSVSAVQFDETTRQEKPRSRVKKAAEPEQAAPKKMSKAPAGKPATPASKSAKSAPLKQVKSVAKSATPAHSKR